MLMLPLIAGKLTAPVYEEFSELAWIEKLHIATISKVRMRSYVAHTHSARIDVSRMSLLNPT
jgi:hypothetical protein